MSESRHLTEYLTLEDLLALCHDLEAGPIRDLGLLDSAAHRPQAHLFGEAAYPSIDEKAAVSLESVVGNYALIDGNKRLGWLVVVVFFGLNQLNLEAPDDEAYDLVMAAAAARATTTRPRFGSAAGAELYSTKNRDIEGFGGNAGGHFT